MRLARCVRTTSTLGQLTAGWCGGKPDRRDLGRVSNEVPERYDRVRPTYPDELFADLVADGRSSVPEVGCGTGQATRSLAAFGCSVTAVEPGAGMAALARQRLSTFAKVEVEISTFEDWDDGGRRFDVLVAASAWHSVDPSVGWRRVMTCYVPLDGWPCSATLSSAGRASPRSTPTAHLHERFSPGNPGWGHPPLEDEVRATGERWGPVDDPGGLFGPTVVRWYPAVQWFDGEGYEIRATTRKVGGLQ